MHNALQDKLQLQFVLRVQFLKEIQNLKDTIDLRELDMHQGDCLEQQVVDYAP